MGQRWKHRSVERLFNNLCWRKCSSHRKFLNRSLLQTIHKTSSRWIKDLNVKIKTITFL